MRRLLVLLVLAPLAAAVPSPAQADPVEPVSFSVIRPWCPGFDVQLSGYGKGKDIETPDGQIEIAPGQVATVTNLNNQKSVTYGITGVFHTTTLADGEVQTEATGRNILHDPYAGLNLTIGDYFYGFKDKVLVEPLHGTGQLVDICAAIA